MSAQIALPTRTPTALAAPLRRPWYDSLAQRESFDTWSDCYYAPDELVSQNEWPLVSTGRVFAVEWNKQWAIREFCGIRPTNASA